MIYLFFLLFILLSVAIFFSVFKTGRFRVIAKVFRIAVVIVSIGVFAIYFTSRSLDSLRENSLSVQVINKLPIPLDFYMIKENDSSKSSEKYLTKHLGTIRSNFYRTDFLDSKDTDQFWIIGFMGKKNLVYFSQHSISEDQKDQKIEVKNYLIQSEKLSSIAKKEIANSQLEAGRASVWITLDLLLIFLNLGLLFRKDKEKIPV